MVINLVQIDMRDKLDNNRLVGIEKRVESSKK